MKYNFKKGAVMKRHFFKNVPQIQTVVLVIFVNNIIVSLFQKEK